MEPTERPAHPLCRRSSRNRCRHWGLRAARGDRDRRWPGHSAEPAVARQPTQRRGGLRAAPARRARRGSARRVPLIRDETGSVIVGRASWLPADHQQVIHGEATVDDTSLFDGDVTGICIEPTLAMPGLRASLKIGAQNKRTRIWRRWIAGRAVQLGSTGVTVVRDGVPAPRSARRSTFYRHVEGWLLVR